MARGKIYSNRLTYKPDIDGVDLDPGKPVDGGYWHDEPEDSEFDGPLDGEGIDPTEAVYDEVDALTPSEIDEFRAIIQELHAREFEALRLYEPMPEQERFHACQSSTRIVIGGNRGGKSLSTMVEIARAATGQDPYGKYDARDGTVIIVGKTLRHIGLVIYPLLFKRGAFKVVRDPVTGKLRSFRPGQAWDEANLTKAVPSPPLIPRRFYSDQSISWENKRESIPKTITLNNGWKILFYSGEAQPPQGMACNLADFDEEITHPQWLAEVKARLLDRRVELPHEGRFRNGRFVWGATPQAGTQQLYELSENANESKDEERPQITQFDMSLLANIHMTQEAKDDFIKSVEGNEDEYNIRVLGLFAIAGSRVYPEFAPNGVHGCESFPIPDSWTRYAFVDPGRQVCAVLFVAVPPPGIRSITHNGRTIRVGGRQIIYSELYIKHCNAAIFAQRLKAHVGEETIFALYIDYRAGKVHEIASGVTIEQRYREALARVRFKASKTGTGFIWAADAVKEGIEAFRGGLHVVDGTARWLVFRDRVPNLIWEAKRYVYKKVPRTNTCTDEPLQRDNHLMDCCRYAALARLVYRSPIKPARKAGSTVAIMEQKHKKAKKQNKSDSGGATIKLW